MTDPTTQSDADAPNLDEEMVAAVEGIDTSDVAASASTATDDVEADGDASPDADEVSSTDADDDVPDDEDPTDADDDVPDDEDPTDDETISVLEFVLGDERYCLDITFIEQIVERGTVTRIPNAPAFVEGVIDLRGDITTVIDPMETLAAESDGAGELIVVFDSERMDDEWSVGWAVDGVRRVSTVSLSAVKESPVDEPWINGVVKREDDGDFVIWTEPGELMRTDGDDAA